MKRLSLQDELINFFESGIKSNHKKNLGIEVEHFIVYSDSLEAVPYAEKFGVRYIIEELMKIYPDAKPLFDEDLIGFSTHNFNITLEPSAQVEISIMPFEDIKIIDKIYSEFLYNIKSILTPLNYQILALGCQPVSKLKSLNLIPKKRYRFIDDYFSTIGTGGIEIMRGTCSTQISIDYFSEEDFRRKMQAAYLFTPFFKLISNSSKMFEGQYLTTFLKRTDIWSRVDPIRTHIPQDTFSDNYGFKNYADYLCKIPPIFLPKSNGEFIYTGELSAEKVFLNRNLSKDDVLHIVSMAFPDVRLKNYIEIRGADSMPQNYILAYCALVKGLLYSDEVLNWSQDFIHKHKITTQSIYDVQNNLIKLGWQANIYDIPAKMFIKKSIDLAKHNLSLDNQQYLSCIQDIIEKETEGATVI